MTAPYFLRRTLTPALLLLALLLVGASAARAQIAVSLPEATGEAGDEITVALTTGDLSTGGIDVYSYNFTLTFDPSVARVTGTTKSGTLSEDALMEVNTNVAGEIAVGAATTTPLTGTGTLLLLEVELLAEGNTALTFGDFTFNDGTPAAATTNGSVTVTVPNQAPTAADDAAVTDEDTPVEIDVLDNDSDDGSLDPSSVAVTSGPASGSTSVNSTTGAITYTPNADVNGSDSFTYTVDDANGATSNAATVTVTINPVNDAPGFTASNETILENAGPQTVNGWATFIANASNPGDEATQTAQSYAVSNVSNPSLFSAGPSVATNGTLTYTAATDVTGSSTFDVTVQDDGGTANGGQNTSTPQTFTITVTDDPVPDAVDDTAVTNEDTAVEVDVLDNDTDNGSLDASSVTVASGPANGSTSISPTTGAITYTPHADVNGQDSFTYTVDDDLGGTSNEATVTVTVNPVNDAPGFTAAGPPASAEDAGAQTVSGWATFIANASNPGDEAGQSVQSYTVSNVSNPGLFSAGPSVATNGTLTYTAADEAFGSSTFDVTVQDDGGTTNGGQDTSVPQTFTITVDPGNDAPAFTSTPVAHAAQDQPYSYIATAEDIDGDALTLSAPTLPSWLTFQDNGDGTGTLSGTPSEAETGDHAVVLEASDGVTMVQQSFTITVSDNLPPVAGDDTATTDEDTPVVINVLGNDTDPEDDALDPSSVTVTSGPASGSTSVNPTTGAITYTPNADVNGQDSFTYTVDDANGATSNAATVTVTVEPVENAPVFENPNPSAFARIGERYSYTVEAVDPDGDPITLSAPTLPSWLDFTDNGNGTGLLEGTPSAEDVGAHDVVLEASDDPPGSASKAAASTQLAFSIVVRSETLATVDDEAEVDEDGSVEIDVLANDSGSLVLSSLRVETQPAHGTAQPDAATGTITYTPAANFYGSDSFTYTIEDGTGTVSPEATVTITVHPLNDPPTPPAAPVITVPEDGSEVVIGGAPGEQPEDPDAPFVVEWKPFTDVDNDDGSLTYTWELSLTEPFSETIQQVEVGTSTSLATTIGEIALLLSSHGVDLYDEVTLYHRVTASDGEARGVSAAYSVTLIRGTLTDTHTADDVPERFILQSNYPNPFNPVTVIEYAVPEAAFVTIRVYSALGQEVATLVSKQVAPGQHQVTFDASELASGTYIYRMEAGEHIAMKKMLLVK